jgi:hypothetical protein
MRLEDLPKIANPNYFYLVAPYDGEHWGEADLIHVATKDHYVVGKNELQTVCHFYRGLYMSKVLTAKVIKEYNIDERHEKPALCEVCNFELDEFYLSRIPSNFEQHLFHRADTYRSMRTGFYHIDSSYGDANNSSNIFKNEKFKVEAMLNEVEGEIKAYFWFVYHDQKGVLYRYYKNEHVDNMHAILGTWIDSKTKPFVEAPLA